MRAALCILALVAVASCANPSRCVRDPRYRATNDDHTRGIPDTIFDTEVLLPRRKERRCQLLIEPTLFGPAYAIWFEPLPNEGFRAVVRLRDGSGAPEQYAAPLNEWAARDLDAACVAFFRVPVGCAGRGIDGTFFHAGHPTGRGSYALRSFWSPRSGSVEEQLAELLLELGDYVMSPESLRGEHASRLRQLAARASARFRAEVVDEDAVLWRGANLSRHASHTARITSD